jgi:hypothetical protein
VAPSRTRKPSLRPRLGLANNYIADNLALGTKTHRIDTKKNDAFAYVLFDKPEVVFLCFPFFTTRAYGRREVITHEYFHKVLGTGYHMYDIDADSERAPQNAIRCPHQLAELVFDIATGCKQGAHETLFACRVRP